MATQTLTPAPKVSAEHPPKPDQGFDMRTHIRDDKGKLIATQHYAIHQNSAGTLIEQPIGSGNMFDTNGSVLGRYEKVTDEKGKHRGDWKKVSDKHTDANARVKALHAEDFKDLMSENDQLRAELDALREENEILSAPANEKAQVGPKAK